MIRLLLLLPVRLAVVSLLIVGLMLGLFTWVMLSLLLLPVSVLFRLLEEGRDE